jgi:ribosomal protein S12 methylthiotransferase
MKRFVEGIDRGQSSLFPECVEDWIDEDNPVRVIDVFVDEFDLAELGFGDRVGCFKYEPVRGASANDLAAAVPDEVKAERHHRFMERRQAISARRLKRRVGTRAQVIIDAVGGSVAKGRTKGDAPEIDGAVYVAAHRPLRVGEIATVKIERADAYDLHGTAVGF